MRSWKSSKDSTSSSVTGKPLGHLLFLARLVAALLCQNERMPVVGFRHSDLVKLERAAGGTRSLTWALPPDIIPEG